MNLFTEYNWLVYGFLIGLFVPIILLIGNKQLGISSVMQNICSVLIPKTKSIFLKEELKNNQWKLFFVVGIILGSIIATSFNSKEAVNFLPQSYYSLEGFITLFLGGVLVGFGTRYANGCTSGHSITGLSLLKFSSLVATISFFAGGLIYTFLLS